MVISFLMSVLVVFIDQLTKFLVYGSPSRSIIGNLLWFESALNKGVAFSMFQNASGFFIFTSSLAVLIFAYLITSKKIVKRKSEKICLGIIMGGTLSNLIDRIIFKGVRDFIYLKFINFAIFNIADMAISFGVIVLCIFILVYDLKSEKEENVASEKLSNENKMNKTSENASAQKNQNIEIEKKETNKDTNSDKVPAKLGSEAKSKDENSENKN